MSHGSEGPLHESDSNVPQLYRIDLGFLALAGRPGFSGLAEVIGMNVNGHHPVSSPSELNTGKGLL